MKHHLLLAGAALLAVGGTAIAQQASSDTMGAPTTSAVDPTSSKNPAMMSDSTAGEASTTAPTSSADATAQTPTDAATAEATTPSSDPATPATATAQSDPMATTGTQPAQSASATGTSSSAGMQTASNVNVQADWAKYDPDNSGSLTALEFGKWVMAANGQDMSRQVDRTRTSRSANLPAVKVLNSTAAAFSKADANKDRLISPDELSTFLAG